ncbi:excinuclease ABC subunit B [candidate division Kazan bacterium RIFCSPHIGHO2_01_FULL_44_14]|uniref:UvrABC system protein B n=1 Tax=candidate division Kazan bacterium RIFCSPLOWO2_01_FULL_45_19 TaxID=1798538 RepID=A0A1F4NPB3_UNCK3|nr:MAG: excinuclease ABC subunit B [candidate division Kazan bacterium RIFCSPLOWO2_01_FULL_45_19]OGB77538.1 MAG: excinuclease ABC subunit B [candidate division Kazan bacterium RIFCSPHIGHO2_01_FULL_44_14]
MANKFKIKSKLKPAGDQPTAIKQLVEGLSKKYRDQTLLGVTGSGKTFTMANVIEKTQKPTLVIVHNKTLAAQLASEFREYFPDNAVHYFVSYYDYYQPEAYIPRTDTYIAKDASINDEIDRLRNAATEALLTRKDVIIVASVSCIYGLGNPEVYKKESIELKVGKTYKRERILRQLADIQYQRNDINFIRGTFRVRGEILEIFPAYAEMSYRFEWFGDKLERIRQVDYLTGEILDEPKSVIIFPAKHFITPQERLKKAIEQIRDELRERLKEFKATSKLLEAQRLEQRTNYDIEMLQTIGYISGIENYSRYLDGRKPGSPPSTLLHYFPDDFLMFIDESHMTLPQIRGMYNGDRARKEVLIEHGFRLPSAFDNRPLQFLEFEKLVNQVIYTSATPSQEELSNSKQIVEQIVRPTGLVDPAVEVRPIEGQVDDLMEEIRKRVSVHQRVLVTTLTKKMAEDLTAFLQEAGIKVQYLHSDVETLERIDILRDLRLGKYDVLVGINLLREGLDLPEVSLVAILDADKEGFLRSDTALIQTFGRAARHLDGRVIMYADHITGSMQRAIDETDRRREKQVEYNKQHKITPTTIVKAIKSIHQSKESPPVGGIPDKDEVNKFARAANAEELKSLLRELEDEMDLAAKNLEFEKATELRDRVEMLKNEIRQ